MVAAAIPRLVVAAPASGSGKTTVATGLMAAFAERGLAVSPHKVGPDYIDPGYHALATGRPGRNLDAFLCGPERIAPLFLHGAAGCELAVVEGVMGLYDGASGHGELGSTAQVAVLLGAPVVLVVDASAQARSVAALVHGFAAFDPRVRIGGVVLNKVGSARHEDVLRSALDEAGVPVLGVLPRTDALRVPARHLGLVPVAERRTQAVAWIRELASRIRTTCDLPAILALARSAPPLHGTPWDPEAELAACGGPLAHPAPSPIRGAMPRGSLAAPRPGPLDGTRPGRGAGNCATGHDEAAGRHRPEGAADVVSGPPPAPPPAGGGLLAPTQRQPHIGDSPASGRGAALGAGRREGVRGGAPAADLGVRGGAAGSGRGGEKAARERTVVAVAAGPAFTFGYAEQHELLAAAGADVVPFDPLRDEALPEGTAGLVLGGGFPEVYAPELSANTGLRAAVAAFGGPIAAECAGLLYLTTELDGAPMCGVLDATAAMTDRLTLGYREAVALGDTVLAPAGTRLRGHEFHRTTVEPGAGAEPAAGTRTGAGAAWGFTRPQRRVEGFTTGNVHASYLHVHWAAEPSLARRFVGRCAGWR